MKYSNQINFTLKNTGRQQQIQMISKQNNSRCKKHNSNQQKTHQEINNQQQLDPNINLPTQQFTKLKHQNIELLMQVKTLTSENAKLKKQLTNLKSTSSKNIQADSSKRQTVLKSQMEELLKLHNKTKKELQNLTKQKQQLIKKNNSYRSKMMSSESQIETLKRVQSSKGLSRTKEIKQNKMTKGIKIDNVEENLKSVPMQKDSTASSLQIQIIKLRQEKRSMEKRIELYEKQRKNTQLTFQPIIQQSNTQIRNMIQEKSKLISQNAQHSKNISLLQMQITDLKQKNVRLIQIMNKQRKEQDKSGKMRQEQKQIVGAKKIQQYEEKIEQLNGLYENARRQIQHLQNVGRYLSMENRKLLDK